MSKWFTNFRYRNSFRFGKIEHVSARILFFAIVLTIGAYYINERQIEKYLLFTDLGLWLIYFIAHNLEKAFHPKH
jgi:hypothetical protein